MAGRVNSWLIGTVLLLSFAASGQARKTFPLVLRFQNHVGNKLLNLDSSYSNQHGETFTVRNFRYYISHFSVIGGNGKMQTLPAYYFINYLIDERKPESKTITLHVPFPIIKSIRFEIGVDSIKNVSGVQVGTLDPANGMFWTWNSGYIFAKLEGISPDAKAPQNNFTYHIGGFRVGENAVRKVTLDLPDRSVSGKEPLIIAADVNAWFGGTHPFKIAEQASVMTPGLQAMQVADNYSRMFSIVVKD